MLKKLFLLPLYLVAVILLEFLLNQLFLEFTPRLDIIFITILGGFNPLTLFILGVMKDVINAQLIGFTALVYLLLFVLHYYYKSNNLLSIIFIFCVEWIVGMVFEGQSRDLMITFSITITIYLLMKADPLRKIYS
jgi:hypothetical protein